MNPSHDTLLVYCTNNVAYLIKEFPHLEDHHFDEDTDGIFFVNYHKNKKLYYVIVLKETAMNTKDFTVIQKTALILHEVSHCVYNLSEQVGIKGDEYQAYMLQWLTSKIAEKLIK